MIPVIPPFTANPSVSAPSVEIVAKQEFKVDETLTIEAPEWYEDFETGVLTFAGGVRATYGPTVITCEKILVDRSTKTFETSGTTKILDPIGVIKADSLKASWADGSKGGTAYNVFVEVGYVKIQGSVLTITTEPEQVWTLSDVRFELSDLATGGNRFLARTLRLYPGKYGVAEHIFYQILGQKLGPIPRQSFNFDRRVSGLKMPSITNRRGVGVGLSWDSSFLLNDQSSIYASWASFPGQLQEYKLQYTTSPLPGELVKTKIAPKDKLAEPQGDGWFDNVIVASPDNERSALRSPKNSFSAGFVWNTSTVGRVEDATGVSKLVDLAFEYGGAAGNAGWIATTRAQRIREGAGGEWIDRAIIIGTYLAPDYLAGDQLSSHLRTDLFGSFSENGTFGYARNEIGVIWHPKPGINIGAAYAVGGQSGRADFTFDKLDYTSAMLLRADYSVGPYTIRYLAKYDFRGQTWYDREWELALAAGSLEPFVLRREFPSDYRIGIRFRIDQFTNHLLDRKVKR